jgi:hypothetical protein
MNSAPGYASPGLSGINYHFNIFFISAKFFFRSIARTRASPDLAKSDSEFPDNLATTSALVSPGLTCFLISSSVTRFLD